MCVFERNRKKKWKSEKENERIWMKIVENHVKCKGILRNDDSF